MLLLAKWHKRATERERKNPKYQQQRQLLQQQHRRTFAIKWQKSWGFIETD